VRLKTCTGIPTLYKLQSNAPIGLIINFKLRNLESLEQKYTSMSRTIQNKFIDVKFLMMRKINKVTWFM